MRAYENSGYHKIRTKQLAGRISKFALFLSGILKQETSNIEGTYTAEKRECPAFVCTEQTY